MNSLFGDCDEEDWPDNALGKGMFQFEETMRCKMCKDYYDNPQVLPCGHTFCAICLTKRFDRKLNPNATDICPQCRNPVQTSQMRLNHELATVIESFKAIRNDLQSNIIKLKVPCSECNNVSSSRSSKRSASASTSSSSSSRQSRQSQTAITKKVPLRSFHGEPLNKIKDALIIVSNNPSRNTLSTTGDKNALEKRYRMFVHLYNAQVDNPSPMTVEEVVDQINEEERMAAIEANKEAKSSGTLNDLKNGKERKIAVDGFKALIKKAKKQQQELQKSATSTPSTTDNDIGNESPSLNSTSLHTIDESASSEPISDQSKTNEYSVGPWHVLMSKELLRPFFYNIVTRTGQFAIPDELAADDGIVSSLVNNIKDSESYESTSPNDKMSCNQRTQPTTNLQHVAGDTNTMDSQTQPWPFNQAQHSYIKPPIDEDSLDQQLTADPLSQPSPSLLSGIEIIKIDVDDNNMNLADQVSDTSSATQEDSNTTNWICDTCTFLNLTQQASCEICDTTNLSFLMNTQVSPTQTQSQTSYMTLKPYSSSAQNKTPSKSTKRSKSQTSKSINNSGDSKKSRIY